MLVRDARGGPTTCVLSTMHTADKSDWLATETPFVATFHTGPTILENASDDVLK